MYNRIKIGLSNKFSAVYFAVSTHGLKNKMILKQYVYSVFSILLIPLPITLPSFIFLVKVA